MAEAEAVRQRRYRHELGSWLLSCLLHAAAFVVLACLLMPIEDVTRPPAIVVIEPQESPLTADELIADSPELSLPVAEPSEAAADAPVPLVDASVDAAGGPISPTAVARAMARPHGQPAASRDRPLLITPGDESAAGEVLQPVQRHHGGGWQGRVGNRKGELLASRGGNEASENAVLRGLRWLAAHQHRDGSWRFNHQHGVCQGQCRHPGNFESTTASTALALLAFLGAGHTQLEGEFADPVYRGLYYLHRKMILREGRGDLQDGSMYGQGLAAIALSEAYALTGDETLRVLAQGSVNFIERAQHAGGGWRYLPGQPGDVTVTGWQWMALKSGQMAALRVDRGRFYAASRFLDSVASHRESRYGYQTREPRPTTSAVALLLRMYEGWRRDDPRLVRGVEYLARRGPSPKDIYYNYYATQVLSHYGGPLWERWNPRMRDQLIDTQATGRHEAGSWYFDHEHSEVGGRLYNTALAIMTLEVYYRYLPLYTPEVARQ